MSGEQRTAFAERLDWLLDRHSAPDVARALKLKGTSGLSHYRVGRREPDIDRLASLARFAGVSVDWLVGVTERERPKAPAKGNDWRELPKVAFAAAGEPLHDLPADATWYAFHQSWVERRFGCGAAKDDERLVVVQVEKKHLGESMLPTIRPGAILVVDRGPGGAGVSDAREVKQGGIYLVQPPDGGLTVKRVYLSEGSLILTSDNPDRTAFPARAVSLKSGRQLQKVLVGRVCWIGHEED